MGDWNVKQRLSLLVLVMVVCMFLIGLVGLHATKEEEAEIKAIFEHQVIPMREVARIRRLVVDNTGQIFRAIQHNPAGEYAKLHDHPVANHLDAITKNLKWMDETFAALKGDIQPGSKEAQLLKEIEAEYRTYVDKALKPLIESMQSGNYALDRVGQFLKDNQAFDARFNPLMRELAEAQEASVKQTYEAAQALSAQALRRLVFVILAGLVAGVGLSIVIIRSITRPLDDMQRVILKAAREHDFTSTVTVSARDELGVTAAAFNELLGALRQTFQSIGDNTVHVDEATSALAAAADQASAASIETSESAASMAASVEQLSVSITSVSESTNEALHIARMAEAHSETGGAVIAGAVNDMSRIADQVREVGGTITVLGEHSNKISSVVQVIKDVADQTNLLALNAAIEAARAGEAGRGFAVVADEVRKLAERTTLATGEIGQMITAIQGSAHTAVHAMEETIGNLQSGTEQAAKAGEAIIAIQQSNAQVLNVVRNISEAMSEQGAASQDIAQRVERVAQASEESSVSVGMSANAAHNIHDLSKAMRHSVSRFKV